MKKGLTLGIIFEAQSANYGEGFGNITELKKITRGNGNGYTYISRQAIRNNIIEQLEWNTTPVEAMGSGDKKVIQYRQDTSIVDYPEIDLFGYMKTTKKEGAKTRAAVVRLSNAISLEPYCSDMDFLTNKGMSNRIKANSSIAQSEIHKSFYAYSITIDLDRVGIDGELVVDNKEKARRVVSLLNTVEFLYHDIKGRRESFVPIFIVGGLYDRKTPFFENRLQLEKGALNIPMLQDAMETILEDTDIGCACGAFKNCNEIKESLKTLSINKMIASICRKVEEAFDESN